MSNLKENFKEASQTAMELKLEDAQSNLHQNMQMLAQLRDLNDRLIGQSGRTTEAEPDAKCASVAYSGHINKLEYVINTERSVLIEIQKEIDNLFKLI